MSQMFCFQCEQTAKCTGCEKVGVCGKQPDTSDAQDRLTCALVALSYAAGDSPSDAVDLEIIEGLFTAVTNVNFDTADIQHRIDRIEAATRALGGKETPDVQTTLWRGDENERSLRWLLLLGMRGMAAYAQHAAVLGLRDERVTGFLHKGLRALATDQSIEEGVALLMEFGQANLACMELLDRANTGSYGTPTPTEVPLTIEKGPFIVISGHDLLDLQMLLEQTDGKGVNIYTHGEMLPAHGYPELKKHPQLKGNFGTAWQSQQKEFIDLPAPVLFTTNCLMPPKSNYQDRIFTTAMVAYPGLVHIEENDGHKDFTPVIEKALELGGYESDRPMTGINGGSTVTTGFGHGFVLEHAGAVLDAVKAGQLRHIFLVGGCDGARPGRNYYTDFVRETPQDSLILTVACGKFRFNDLQLGTVGGLPRLMDMGQCNDAYSAIRTAVALAEALGCGVNDLPLSLVLSWYEQKAVAILLTLLSLGIKNILLGPTLPAFVSPTVLNFLVENFGLTPISTPQEDLKKLLA